MFINYGGNNSDLRIIGVGKHNENDVAPMVQGRILPYVKDNDTQNVWEEWEVQDRDLIFLDKEGNFHSKVDLNSGFPEDEIIDIINQLLDQ